MARSCIHCGTDIAFRNRMAKQCFDCYEKRSHVAVATRAWRMVFAAVRSGILPRPQDSLCTDCSQPATEYDHRDYSQPLLVDPVCRSCNALRGPAKHSPCATAA